MTFPYWNTYQPFAPLLVLYSTFFWDTEGYAAIGIASATAPA